MNVYRTGTVLLLCLAISNLKRKFDGQGQMLLCYGRRVSWNHYARIRCRSFSPSEKIFEIIRELASFSRD